jgi:hypothetical protein
MTRLGRASVFLAVFAGGYAILMLINGQLTDFGVSVGVCAVALLGAALFAWRAGYGRAPAALPAAVVSTLEPHVSEEVLDSGVGDDRDRATGSGPDSDDVGIYGFNVDGKNGRHCVSWVIDSDCPPGITKHRRSHAREQNFSSLSRNTLPFGAVERIHLCLVVSAFFSSGLGTRTMAICSVMSTPIVAATPAVAGMT